MRLLLDSHVVLWTLFEPERLDRSDRDCIVDPDNQVFVSVVTAWELTIKWSLDKLPLPRAPHALLREALPLQRMLWLPILDGHIEPLAELPHHHKDPFDRLLIAQAITESLTAIT